MKKLAHSLATGRDEAIVSEIPTRKGPLGWLMLVGWVMTATRAERRRALRL